MKDQVRAFQYLQGFAMHFAVGVCDDADLYASVMPTRPMRMAVCYLFRIGGAYFDDFDIEGQSFTGHGVVGV
jgi:hypothetical protein